MDNVQTIAAEQTHRSINWGGVIKGVAIVAAVAVAGVVAYSVIGGIAGYATTAIAANPTTSAIAAGISQSASWLGSTLTYGVEYIGGFLGQMTTMALSGLGLGGATWGGAAATKEAVSLAGAGVATAAATHAALPAIHNLQLTTPTPADANPSVESGLLAAQGAQTAHAASHASALHEVTHAAHHAAESAHEHEQHKQWSAKFAAKAAYASHADAVRATAAPRSVPQPADSFSAQLNADRASLDTALAK
jgi:hypothetical protein